MALLRAAIIIHNVYIIVHLSKSITTTTGKFDSNRRLKNKSNVDENSFFYLPHRFIYSLKKITNRVEM